MRKRHGWTAMAMGALLSAPVALEAQSREGPTALVGISFVVGSPVGDLGTFFDRAFGVNAQGVWLAADDGRLRLRADLGFLNYGHESFELCHSISCRVGVELTTMNNIFHAGVGPEYAVPMGAFEPYAYATTGLSYFVTTSTLGDGGGGDWAETTNFDDLVMAWRFGGGMRLSLSRGRTPVGLDFGVERHQNGIANFLTEGDILDNPDGSVTLFPNRSEANLLTFRFGLSIGVGGGRADD